MAALHSNTSSHRPFDPFTAADALIRMLLSFVLGLICFVGTSFPSVCMCKWLIFFLWFLGLHAACRVLLRGFLIITDSREYQDAHFTTVAVSQSRNLAGCCELNLSAGLFCHVRIRRQFGLQLYGTSLAFLLPLLCDSLSFGGIQHTGIKFVVL